MPVLRALTVRQLNMYVKSVLDGDRNLKQLVVRGEISNYNRNVKSGHAYFTLKDADAAVRVVMFQSYISQVRFEPRDGLEVYLSGRVTLYEKDGQYQLYAEQMTPVGVGGEYLRFLQLKEKLEKEGLFDAQHKKNLPRYPQKIGLATSRTGAAVHDLCSIIARRYPVADILIYPCLVQGTECAASVIKAIDFFNEQCNVDVIVVARGGGSYEDLAGFNDEELARTVYRSDIPVVSAVGHEVDYTILDFVADLRAATPSAAAELITPDKRDLRVKLDQLSQFCLSTVEYQLQNGKSQVEQIRSRIRLSELLNIQVERLDYLTTRIADAVRAGLGTERTRLEGLVNHINGLNPLSILSRGFSVAIKDGCVAGSVEQFRPGDPFELKLKDGVVNCVAESTKKDVL